MSTPRTHGWDPPPAGPHTGVENSREIIRTVFSAPNTFAVVDKATGKVIGSSGFVNTHREGVPKPDDEIGYALNPAFWGRGLIPEAVEKLLEYGFRELGLAAVWCSHYAGNQKSRRVIEKCGFLPRGSAEENVPLLGSGAPLCSTPSPGRSGRRDKFLQPGKLHGVLGQAVHRPPEALVLFLLGYPGQRLGLLQAQDHGLQQHQVQAQVLGGLTKIREPV